ENRRTLLKAHYANDQPIKRAQAEDVLSGRLEHDIKVERLGKAFGHVAVPAAVRCFLNRHDVGIQRLQFSNGHIQPFFETGSAIEESRGSAVVQQVKGDDSQWPHALFYRDSGLRRW